MRLSLIILLTLIFKYGTAQKLNVNYRTSIEKFQSLHYLTFIDNVKCKLIFPARGHGDAMVKQKSEFDLNYRLSGDTIVFSGTDLDTNDVILKRVLNSRLIIKLDETMYDFISGYTYVDKKSIDDKYTIYAVDGEIFKQKTTKTDGYGLVVKDYKTNGRLRRKIERIDKDKYVVNILRGKSAYDKYGLIGMNGVIEFEQKK